MLLILLAKLHQQVSIEAFKPPLISEDKLSPTIKTEDLSENKRTGQPVFLCDYYGMLLSAAKAGKIKEQNPHKADAESFLSAVSGQG